MRWPIVLAASVAATVGLASAEPACRRCETSLDLSRAEWTCMVQRLPEFRATTTSMVFFSLPPQICTPDLSTTRSGASVKVPGSTTPATAETPPRVFRLSRQQVECLAREAPRVRPGARVTFNFESVCGTQPASVAPSPEPKK